MKTTADGQKEEPETSWFAYFRLLFSEGYTSWDVLLLLGGIVGSIAAGIPFPLLGILSVYQLLNPRNLLLTV